MVARAKAVGAPRAAAARRLEEKLLPVVDARPLQARVRLLVGRLHVARVEQRDAAAAMVVPRARLPSADGREGVADRVASRAC